MFQEAVCNPWTKVSFHLLLTNLAIEDYFYMMTEFLEGAPVVLVSHPVLPSIVDCALQCLDSESAATLVSIYEWITRLFETLPNSKVPASCSPLLETIVLQKGKTLVSQSFKGLLHHFPREREVVSYVGDCFKAFYQLSPGFLFELVGMMLDSLDEQSYSQSEKAAFKEKFR